MSATPFKRTVCAYHPDRTAEYWLNDEFLCNKCRHDHPKRKKSIGEMIAKITSHFKQPPKQYVAPAAPTKQVKSIRIKKVIR